MCKCARCTVDDSCCFHDIRLGPKTSVYHVKDIVVSTASGSDVTCCATTLQGFNKQILRSVPSFVVPFKQGKVAFLRDKCQSVLGSDLILRFFSHIILLFKRQPFLILRADVVKRLKF